MWAGCACCLVPRTLHQLSFNVASAVPAMIEKFKQFSVPDLQREGDVAEWSICKYHEGASLRH